MWFVAVVSLLSSVIHADSCSKHVLNAQVSIRAPCCKQWFDCAECHAETQDHRLKKTTEMAFACKKCKKVFRKDMSNYEESDEYCPHCDNHYVRADPVHRALMDMHGRSSRQRHPRPCSVSRARMRGWMHGASRRHAMCTADTLQDAQGRACAPGLGTERVSPRRFFRHTGLS